MDCVFNCHNFMMDTKERTNDLLCVKNGRRSECGEYDGKIEERSSKHKLFLKRK